MSITVTSQLGAVLDGIEQQVGVSVTLGLTVGPYRNFSPQSLSLSVQNGTDLPNEVRNTVGFSSMGGQLVLSGSVDPAGDETKSVAWLLNPDETTSPLYRTSIKGVTVTIDLGYQVAGTAGMQWVRKFTGSVASYTLDHGAGTATLNIVDRSVDYDTTPDIPAVATQAPYNAGLTSAFPMDAIIRSGGRPSSWPATRPQCVLAAGLRSSVWPEVGTFRGLPGSPIFLPGIWGPAYTDTGLGALTYTLAGTGSTYFVECWVTGVDTSHGVQLALTASGSGQTFPVALYGDHVAIGSSGTWTVATDTGGHYFAALINLPAVGGTTVTGTVWIDGASQTFTTSGAALGSAPFDTLQASVITGATLANTTIEGLQVTLETAPVPSYPFTPAAVLDVSLNPLTVVPEVPAGSKGSDVLQTIASAELGYARWDEQGVFRFTNRRTIASAGSTRKLTSTNALKAGMTTSVGTGAVYDHIQVPFTEWVNGAPTAIYTLDSIKSIAPHSTLSWTQPLTTLAVNVDTSVVLLPNGQSPTDGGSYYRASADQYGIAAHPGLTVSVVQLSAGSVWISVTNPTAQTAWLTSPASYTDITAGSVGSGLWIGGTPVTPGDEAFTDSVYGAGKLPALVLGSNPYRQDHAASQAVGDFLLPQLAVAIRDFTNVAIIPDPRLQLPDRVQLVDSDRARVNEYAQAWGWQLDIDLPAPGKSGGRWDMSLDLRALGPPGAWLLGIPSRSELGDGASVTGTAYLY